MSRTVLPTTPLSARLLFLLCWGLLLTQLAFPLPAPSMGESRLAVEAAHLTRLGTASEPLKGARAGGKGAGWLDTLNSYFGGAVLVPQQQSASAVVISQVYGGGGNSGSTYKNDFIELFNRGNTIVDLTNWSVQYAAVSSSTWQVVTLSGSLGPGQYFLVQGAQGAGGTTGLPAPDALSTLSLNATAGKVALVNTSTPLNTAYLSGNPYVADAVGYGSSASNFEGDGPTPAPGNINAVLRANGGCTDTDNNSTDFDAGAPSPRNTGATARACGGGLPPSAAVVISEFRTRGPNGGYDEFVELHNMTDDPVDVGGWKIKASNGTGGVATRVTINAGTTLPARGHFLATNNSAGGAYGGAVAADQTFTTGIPDDGGIAVFRPDDVLVDRVGMSNGSAFKESRALDQLATNSDRSYERKPGGALGSSQDTDDNPSDFQARTPSDPQNLSSPPSPRSNQPPSANAGGPYAGTAGTSIALSGVNSSDPDGSVVGYGWDFGDGASGAGPTPSHTYAAAGIYNLTLTVSDDRGGVATATATVTVSPQGQTAPGAPASPPTRYSLSLNGATAFAEVLDSDSLDLTTPFTVEAWVKTNSASSQQGIVERYNWLSTDDGGFALRLLPGGKIQFGTVRNSASYDFLVGNASVTAGVWHHIAGVYDGGELRIYLDGALDASRASTLSPAAGTRSLKIGAQGDGAAHTFDGQIDDVRITGAPRYRGDFTPERNLGAGGLATEADGTSCRGAWNFDGQSLQDASGHGNHATLAGGAIFSADTKSYESNATSDSLVSASATTTRVALRFDDITPGTVVNQRYPEVTFSADGNLNVTVYNAASVGGVGSSPPNTMGVAGGFFNTSVTMNFTKPVDNLSFLITGTDNDGTIALVDVYQNNVYKATRPVRGIGRAGNYTPLPINVGSEFNHVTAVVVYNITDVNGIGFDDFVFDLPTPTPTPTPAPTPTPTPVPRPTPWPPTGLEAEANKQEVSLGWTPSAGATSYNVKRRASNTNWVNIATGLSATRFTDPNVIPDVLYFYAVSAVNANGESPDSNAVEATLAPSCGDHVEPRPAPVHLAPPGNGWETWAEVTDRDGLVLRDVKLNGRYMAKMISVPYFTLKLRKGGATLENRAELTPDSDAPAMRVRLNAYGVKSWTSSVDGHVADFTVYARYAVDRIFATSKSCLFIEQRYEFHERRPGDRCEPSANLPCARFYPTVSYRFVPRDGEVLDSINVPQRFHYDVEALGGNTVALFRDCDTYFSDGPQPLGCGLNGLIFERKENPLLVEFGTNVIKRGQDAGAWDNVHQTWKMRVKEPLELIEPPRLSPAGCPECVHTHWRWSATIPEILLPGFNGGRPIIGTNMHQETDQDVDFALVRYRTGEEHPTDYKTLLRSPDRASPESLFNLVTVGPPSGQSSTTLIPSEVVFWYSATGHNPESDIFFAHGTFFNPSLASLDRPLLRSGAHTDGFSITDDSQDGPTSVTYGRLYQDGSTTFTEIAPLSVAPMPPGYIALNNRGYDIHTEAVVSGPHTVSLRVPSVSDQAAFNSLRVFHAEQDSFDPGRLVWVDRTILSPDPLGMDFNTRTIRARVDEIGAFVIASPDGPPPPNTARADLAVSVSDSPDPVVSDEGLTYSLKVVNNGPQPATEVRLVNNLSPDVNLVSFSPSQGSCEFEQGNLYCRLGSLANGASAVVNVNVNPVPGGTQPQTGAASISSTTLVKADEVDPDTENNVATESTEVLPNPNARPAVSIDGPLPNSILVGPANVTVRATAADSDGAVSAVDFYDKGELIGRGAATGVANQYGLSWNNVGLGQHSLMAVTTDNGGRRGVSTPVSFLVNGPAVVSITSPLPDSVSPPGSELTITARASHPSGSISKVEFFANNTPVGVGETAGGDQYMVAWSNVPAGRHSLVAVATDGSGLVTLSSPVVITVGTPPSVNILNPADGASFSSSPAITIAAHAQGDGGPVRAVNFYANGVLVGNDLGDGSGQFSFTWRNPPDGIYSLKAVAFDDLGTSSTSSPVNVSVNRPARVQGEFTWVDDSLPAGASAGGDEAWYWVDANPAPLNGLKSHQSKIAAGTHQHVFYGATDKLPVNAGDRLFTHVFLDRDHLPGEIMVQWHDDSGWEHRAYWGANTINMGVPGTDGRRYMGPLPLSGRWIRLEVPADLVGLNGKIIDGMAFTLDGGRATWDRAGKATLPAAPPASQGDLTWVDDGLPGGAVTSNVDDDWIWRTDKNIYPIYSGQQSHETYFRENDDKKFRSHYFSGVPSQNRMVVQQGDVLFTYVYLYPTYTPDEIMLEWNDGSGWEHRAYWGSNWIVDRGVNGTESRRYMGLLPPAGRWVRLEVPASYVGLEGKTVAGLAFSVYREGKNPRVTWDASGRAPMPLTMLPQLHATTPLYRFFGTDNGGYYFYSTNDIGRADQQVQKVQCYIFPAQAAGTVALHRFRHKVSRRYFYITDRNSPSPDQWEYDGVAGYVYPDGSVPGTVPLHRFQGAHDYFFTTDRKEGDDLGYRYDGVACYVHDAQFHSAANPIDDTAFFVRQQYYDFLNREPEPGGFKGWIDILNNCPAGSTACDRIEVSSAFFRSAEFYDRGYFLLRFYEVALGRQPFYAEFMPDLARTTGFLTAEQLEANKAAFVLDFTARPAFKARYDGLGSAAYVDTLLMTAGVNLTNRDAWVGALEAGQKSRAQVLREVTESPEVGAKFYNKSFVVMQYFGYLRRDPDILYLDWIRTLDATGDYRTMINGFVNSLEYRQRFAP